MWFDSSLTELSRCLQSLMLHLMSSVMARGTLGNALFGSLQMPTGVTRLVYLLADIQPRLNLAPLILASSSPRLPSQTAWYRRVSAWKSLAALFC